MKKLYLFLFLTSCVLCLVQAQSSKYDLWKAAVEKHIQNGTFDGFHAEDDVEDGLRLLEKSGAVCPEVDAGYGTNGWTPNSSPATNNADPSCIIQDNLLDCNGGKYRIALRTVVFECPSWSGTNYLETARGGFEGLSDEDISNRFIKINQLLANANLELVEVERVRITDCDMYDFYFKRWGRDPNNGASDGVNDEDQLEAFESPNVLNLFWVGGFNGRHDCCGPLGFMDKLPTSRNYGVMRYSVAMNQSSLEHDLGHFFGIYHPHWDLEAHENVKVGYPDGALDNSDCRTHGDGICDTWPGAALEYKCPEGCQVGTDELCYQGANCSFNMSNYRCVNGHSLVIHPDDGQEIAALTSTVLSHNIATYNGDNCRLTFTPCQYYKMNAIAKSCRSHLCIQDHDAYFQSTSDYQKRVGLNQAIPSFEAGKIHTSFDGSAYSVDCFDWFLGEDDLASQAVLKGSSSFDPSSYINGAGTYTFYMAEVNALNNPPCKLPVTITVTEDTGTGGNGNGNGNGGGNTDNCEVPLVGQTTSETDVVLNGGESAIDLVTSGATLGNNEVLAWWITKNASAGDQIDNQGTLDNQLSKTQKNPANDGSVITESANAIFEADEVADGLIVDCANLDHNAIYYATPFVAKVTSQTTGGGGGTANSCTGSFSYANSKHKGDPLRVAILKKGSLSCASNDAPAYTLTVNVSNYTGTNEDFRMYIVPETSRKLIKLIRSGGNGIYTFTEDDLDGFDPNPEGIRVAVLEEDGNGGKDATLDVSLAITYGSGGSDAVTTYTWSATYSDCLFGEPVAFQCLNALDNPTSNTSASLETSFAIRVFPSPAVDNFVNIQYLAAASEKAVLQVFDSKGKEVMVVQEYFVEGINRTNLAIDNFEAGVYTLKITQSDNTQTTRFATLR